MRRLAALVFNLPPDSASHRAINGIGAWTQERELLAAVVESLDELKRIGVLQLHKGSRKPPPKFGPPMRIEHPDRPGGRVKRKVGDALGDLKRLFGRVNS